MCDIFGRDGEYATLSGSRFLGRCGPVAASAGGGLATGYFGAGFQPAYSTLEGSHNRRGARRIAIVAAVTTTDSIIEAGVVNPKKTPDSLSTLLVNRMGHLRLAMKAQVC